MYSQLSTAGAKVLLFWEICKALGVKNCFCAAKHVFLPDFLRGGCGFL